MKTPVFFLLAVLLSSSFMSIANFPSAALQTDFSATLDSKPAAACTRTVCASTVLSGLAGQKRPLDGEKVHIDNSLEYALRSSTTNTENVALCVLAKRMLQAPITYEREIVNYFNEKQAADPDHAWSGSRTKMFTTYRVLWAYYLLNATPALSMDKFFSRYDTIREVISYSIHESGTDLRDAYHITFSWVLHYGTLPPYLPELFKIFEQDLSWTTSADFHRRTHIALNYVLARRPLPNIDGIIDITKSMQQPDGSWLYMNNPMKGTAYQLNLLYQIMALHPGYRTADIHNMIRKTQSFVLNSYNRAALPDGKTGGYFGTIKTVEDALVCGILDAGQDGLLTANIDMALTDIVNWIT
jgi:hypothetical protein